MSGSSEEVVAVPVVDPLTRREGHLAKFAHRPSLDGLRGLAAIMVVLYHCDTPGFAQGFFGVDIFFVLSGFLISSLLLRELANTHWVSLPAFYARRFRRLLPASALCLLITAAAYRFAGNPLTVLEMQPKLISAALYASNYFMIASDDDYFGDSDLNPVQHYWSLNAEEQIYFVWPVFFWMILILVGYNVRSKVLLGGMGVLTVALGGYTLSICREYPMLAYMGTFERLYEITGGAFIALLTVCVHLPSYPQLGQYLPLVSVLMYEALFFFPSSVAPTVVCACACVTTLLLLVGVEASNSDSPSPVILFLEHPWLTFLGARSYSLYLWHWPVVVVGAELGLPESQPLRTLVVVVLSALLTLLSYRLVETPTRKLSVSRYWLVIGFSLVLTVAMAGAVAMLSAGDERTQALYDAKYTALANEVEQPEPVPAVAALSPVSEGEARVKPRREKPLIFLGGDSLAGRFDSAFQKLSDEGLFDFGSIWASACPWFLPTPDFYVWNKQVSRTPACLPKHEARTQKVQAEMPDMLILINWAVDMVLDEPLKWSLQYEREEFGRRYVKRCEEAVKLWTPYTRVVVAHLFQKPQPVHGLNPDKCIAESEGRPADYCDTTPGWGYGLEGYLEGYLDSFLQDHPELKQVKLGDLFCGPEMVCEGVYPSKINGEAVWSDPVHPTHAFMKESSSRLQQLLLSQGVDLERGLVWNELPLTPLPSAGDGDGASKVAGTGDAPAPTPPTPAP